MGIVIAIVVVVVIVVVLAVVLGAIRRRRRTALRDHFGSEYERAVETEGGRRRGESALKERIEERKQLDIRPLSPESRDAYASDWQRVQGEFVDLPDTALAEADALVSRMMRDRGYPMDDFEHQASLISVDHPDVVVNYRQAHETYLLSAQGKADTERQRQGLLSYRALFDEMLDARDERDETPSR